VDGHQPWRKHDQARSHGDSLLEVEVELNLAESSRTGRSSGSPGAEWSFDPMDVQRAEGGHRSLLGAIGAMEGDDHQDDDRAAGS
jgi:hypothetical protein